MSVGIVVEACLHRGRDGEYELHLFSLAVSMGQSHACCEL